MDSRQSRFGVSGPPLTSRQIYWKRHIDVRFLTSNAGWTGQAMVEVLKLKADESAPNGAAWVLIQRQGELFAVNGVAKGNAIDASFAPQAFDSAEEAIKASVAWADLLEIPVIYVRDEP